MLTFKKNSYGQFFFDNIVKHFPSNRNRKVCSVLEYTGVECQILNIEKIFTMSLYYRLFLNFDIKY